ncbi:MAG: hypothetical protein EP319_18465 [Deltaproteobacteria bacterium]|nr:MAG: hypothetical protein EP319_18465 [Deltaproteobacteria bacterium]
MCATGVRMSTNYFSNADQCVEETIAKLGKKIVMGIPLALGKPNHIVNAFYRKAKKDKSISLKIVTALTLGHLKGKSLLESRFIEPFSDRLFEDYPDFDYALDRAKGKIPSNIEIYEFYFPAGKQIGNEYAQQNYISSNYTHVARDMMDHGVNVLAQMVHKRSENGETTFSLSCNPDVTVDLVPLMMKKEKETGEKVAFLAQVNNNLPYMYGDAVVPESFFTDVVESPDLKFKLFGPPKMAVSDADFMIGLNASALVKDGGAIQVGIGALGDAVNYGLILREKENDLYRNVLKDTGISMKFAEVINKVGSVDKFQEGLFGATEMFVDGFMDLYNAGVIKKKVYNDIHIQRLLNEKKIKPEFDKNIVDHLLEAGAIHHHLRESDVEYLKRFGILKAGVEFKEGKLYLLGEEPVVADLDNLDTKDKILDHFLGNYLKDGHVIHGGFFLGPNKFYNWLNSLSEDERKLFFMTSVGGINQLYWSETIDTLQRKDARFINTCLYVTMNGGVCSDGLENGEIISGVGGQYNFVAMSHAIPGGRSILKLRATRYDGKKLQSNIMWNYGHITIPRHLRDLIVTEYGIADLRGKADKDIIKELLKITDSRFQEELLSIAKKYKKVEKNWQIPKEFCQNTPDYVTSKLKPYKEKGYFDKFPFGTDFTEEEIIIGGALKKLKKATARKPRAIKILLSNLVASPRVKGQEKYLERMNLLKPKGFKERFFQKLLLRSLNGEFN